MNPLEMTIGGFIHDVNRATCVQPLRIVSTTDSIDSLWENQG